MTDRLLLYPLLLLTILQLTLLLRHASRWLLVPILRHLIVLAVAIVTLFTGAVGLAWGLFVGLILGPRFVYRWAVRCVKAGQVEWARWLRRIARCGARAPADSAELPAELRGEIQLWELWVLTGTQQWERAVSWYENVATWGTLGTALEARLAVARAYAATGQIERAVRSLVFVALSPRTVGALAREYQQVRALLPAHELLQHAEAQTAEWRALFGWTRPGRVTAGLLVALGAAALTGDRWFEEFGNLPWREVAGEWYRPMTALWLHAGVEHVAMNALALWIFGSAIEKAWGGGRMLVCFVLAGTVANVVSAAVGGFDISVGASGGVFGLVGAFGVAVYRLRGVLYAGLRRQLLLMLSVLVVVDVVIGGLEPQIDNVAHVAGLLAGIALGLGFRNSTRTGAVVSVSGDDETAPLARDD